MKILIVEDEPQLGTYLKRAVEEEGYAVELLTNGREAYEYIEDFGDELDLIILDILLPELSGLQICRKIRKKNIAVPVLMLTARDEESDKIEGLDSGADDYLTKPFSLPELLARVRSLMRRAHGEITNMITIGDITIDLKKMQVIKNSKRFF
jgi:DNA-binding response OmpR family regulator